MQFACGVSAEVLVMYFDQTDIKLLFKFKFKFKRTCTPRAPMPYIYFPHPEDVWYKG